MARRQTQTDPTRTVDQTVSQPLSGGFQPGDLLALPNDSRILILGRADPATRPDSAGDGGPLYQASLDGESALYAPYNLDAALAAGAEYVGRASLDDDETRTPFWCDSCERAHPEEDQHATWHRDLTVCSFGCGQRAEQERRKARLDDATPGGDAR